MAFYRTPLHIADMLSAQDSFFSSLQSSQADLLFAMERNVRLAVSGAMARFGATDSSSVSICRFNPLRESDGARRLGWDGQEQGPLPL
eukprot:6621515-Pyramimonas_sp.AAC.1